VAEARTITSRGELLALAGELDRLALARGDLADPWDSGAYLAAWLATAGRDARPRCPAVLDGDGRLLGLLPLVAERGGIAPLGLGTRPRFRPVLAGRDPDPAVVAALAEELARDGIRELTLPALPTRDPATAALEEALERTGFAVERRETTEECLALVDGGWEGHRKRFRKVDRTAKNFTNKAKRLGEVVVRRFGPDPGELDAGWPVYLELHARGWKGELREPMRSFRERYLREAGRRGWTRLFVLEVAGVPAAAIAWFHLGEVAVAYSTVYDARMAAISPGTILMWRSHEEIFAERVPGVCDLLPGHGAQKDQLGPDRTPLVVLEARRGARIAGLGRDLARAARGIARRVAGAGGSGTKRPDPAATGFHADVAWPPVAATNDGQGTPLPVVPLEVGPREEILLAVAAGVPSPKRLRERWDEGDRWLAVGKPAVALVRVGAGGTVREVVLAPGAFPSSAEALVSVARALAAADEPAGAPPSGSVPVTASSFSLLP